MDLVEAYLLNEKPYEIKFYPNSDKMAVLIEPRPLPILPYIIWNVMRNLGEGWNLMIFGTKDVYKLCSEKIPGKYYIIDPNIPNFYMKTHSLFLRSSDFWEKIPAENILLFQWDSFMLKPLGKTENLFEKYPMIGATYNFVHQQKKIDITCPYGLKYNINGGFSFRKKSVMIECIQKVTKQNIIDFRKKHNMDLEYFENEIILNEDVFFCNALPVLGYPLPTREECNLFCIQNDVLQYTTCAIHNFQHDYIDRKVLKIFLDNHPNTI